MATQGERRTATREALLTAAARLIADQGIDQASVDAIAREAGRTSGALYDHFGSKEGLLFALLEGWVDDVAAVVAAELVTALTVHEQMAALWHNFSDPAVGDGRWLELEHELWAFATRNAAARERLAERYRAAWGAIDADHVWASRADGSAVGPVLVGMLLGLAMVRRIDPGTLTDDMAVAALCSVVGPDHTTTDRTTTDHVTIDHVTIDHVTIDHDRTDQGAPT